MGISRDKAHKRRATGGKKKRIRMKRKYEMGRQPANTKIGEKKITRIRVRGGNFKFRGLRLDHGNYSWAGEAVTRKTRILKVVYNSTNNELVRTNTLVKGSIIQIDSTPFKAWYLQYYNIDLSNKLEIAAAVAVALPKDTKDATKKIEKSQGKKEEKGQAKKEVKVQAPKEEKGKAKKEVKVQAPKEDKGKAKKEEPKAKAKPEEKPASAKKEEKTTTETKKSGQVKKEQPKPKSTTTSAKGKPKIQEDTLDRKEFSKKAVQKFTKRNSKRLLEPALADQYKTGRLYAKITSRPGQSGRCDGYILEGDELAFYLKKINLKKKK